MSPKISFWLLLRLAVLLAAFLVRSSEGATFQDFKNRHIDHPKTGAANVNAYCNLMMRRRGMAKPVCKPTNTLINASPNDLQNICRGSGRNVKGNIFESNAAFSLVTCRNRGSKTNCRYVGKQETRKVRVACVNRLPVHFDGLA